MTDRLVKFEDLKVGDKINYMNSWCEDEWDSDVGTFVKQEGTKYWFELRNRGFTGTLEKKTITSFKV